MMTAKGGRVSQLSLWSSEKTSREYGAGTAHMGSRAHSYTSLWAQAGLSDSTAPWRPRCILLLARSGQNALMWSRALGRTPAHFPVLLPSQHTHQLLLRKAGCLLLQPRKRLGQWLCREGRIYLKCLSSHKMVSSLKIDLLCLGRPRLPKYRAVNITNSISDDVNLLILTHSTHGYPEVKSSKHDLLFNKFGRFY